MSNIDTPVLHTEVDDDTVTDLGEALQRRLANAGLPQNDTGAEDMQPPVATDDVEADPPSAASTDSTGEGEVAAAITTPVAPVTEPDASNTGEGAASQGAGSATDGVDVVTDASTPSTFKVNDRDYTPDDITRLQALNDWASALDPRLAQAMAAVESGQAAAIPAAEYAQFQAWKTAQGSKQQSAAQDDLLDGLDDQQLAYVRQLENLAGQQRGPDPALVQQQQQSIQAELNQRVLTFVDTAKSWGDARGLTEQQVADLTTFATDHGVFQSLAQAETEYHPVNGTVLRGPDMASVTTKALNFALASDPGLFTRVAESQARAVTQAQATALADTAVSQKKARSASLAAAPSQATVTPPMDVTKLNREELKSSMSQFISQSEGLPLHD